jgi:hypothetical protein
VDRRHLERVLARNLGHYNTARPHRGIDLDVPSFRRCASGARVPASRAIMIRAACRRAGRQRVRSSSVTRTCIARVGARPAPSRAGPCHTPAMSGCVTGWVTDAVRAAPAACGGLLKTELGAGDLLINTAPGPARHVVIFDQWTDATMGSYVGYEQYGDGGTHRAVPYRWAHIDGWLVQRDTRGRTRASSSCRNCRGLANSARWPADSTTTNSLWGARRL